MDHKPFLKAITDAPGDHARVLAYADHLDELGDAPAAEALRWAARMERCPRTSLDKANRPYWWWGRSYQRASHRPGNQLPNDLFAAMVGDPGRAATVEADFMWRYPDVGSAWWGLIVGWKVSTDRQRQEWLALADAVVKATDLPDGVSPGTHVWGG